MKCLQPGGFLTLKMLTFINLQMYYKANTTVRVNALLEQKMKKLIAESEVKLISIGDVAKSMGVSRMCIIRMEKDGLLTPAWKSPESGYRYYSPQNVVRIISVLNLQRQGFTHDEIRMYFEQPEGRILLYDKLLQKQKEINAMVAQMRRTIEGKDRLSAVIDNFTETRCYVKSRKSKVFKGVGASLIKDTISEAVKFHIPLSYIKHIWVKLDVNGLDEEVVFSAYVPVRGDVEGENICIRPAFKGLSVKWFGGTEGIAEAFLILENTMKNRNLTPAGSPWVLCLGVDMFNDEVNTDNIILNIVVPVAEA